MTDDRSAFTEARDAGLAKRQETREARAIRRQVAEEIAQALEEMQPLWSANTASMGDGIDQKRAAGIAREIGAHPLIIVNPEEPS